MLKRSTILLLLGTLSTGMLSAQTVQWAVRPTSAQIENYGSLLKVNDMDPVAFGEDIRLHPGIPLVRAMAEMDTAFQ